MSLTIMRRIKFCAGHRLHGHGGKCEHFHGHNYVADFFVTGDQVDSVGRVLDFADLKARTKNWIDENWDHSFLVFDQDQNAIAALAVTWGYGSRVELEAARADGFVSAVDELAEACAGLHPGGGGSAD